MPKDIIIELAREKNSDEERKIIRDVQKRNQQTRDLVDKVIKETGKTKAKGMVEKLILHDKQEGKCLYSLKSIPLEDLLNNPHHYEVDHIIPRSVSYDNSMNNKVLVLQEENSKKSNQTPFQYFNSSNTHITFKQFKQHVLNLSKTKDRITKKKKEYLLEERDINKFSVQKEFINRNLVDTRYATRELMTLLRAYFSANELDVKVKAINGGFTSYLRKRWDFKKDRNAGYKHHAEDALIIANVDFIFKQLKALDNAKKVMEGRKVQVEKDNVEDNEHYESLFREPDQIKEIKLYDNYKFSHRVDKKPNRELINDTIYSTRKVDNKTYTIQTVNNIYDKQNDQLKKLFNKSPEKFLMYKHDPKTFDKLATIMRQYKNEKNPLYKFHDETGEYLTKYAKKDNGPIVKSLKYIGKQVNAHLDITNDYENSNNKVVKLSLKPFRFDVYLDDGKYKFVTVKYLDIIKKDTYYVIDEEKYKLALQQKKISENAKFIGSFYNNDLIKINGELLRVIGVNDDAKNTLELNMIDISYRDYVENMNLATTPRIRKNIGKSITILEKYTTDILGNTFKISSPEKPQFIFKVRD
ncbi:CRISPR-system-like protein [Staphylococcus massiliensis S46]|uniref:CRISPR-system-like protein n=1 Tax=Staphylococcus massiliensis S46 TaxID=1229783 RepID=K9B5K9_9STAP|nr:type II CRISPR RNA-guided endonuclease Cas9 [Staphylococcus massiliensis]EKU50117.1 CRISPR-system-like protein [Staphylococcus massiliensis S46]